MKRTVCHIVSAVVLGLLLVSCSGGHRIIPRATLVDIYADMFIADQWIKDQDKDAHNQADTSLFYDPIFARYGYTFEDYDASVKHYLKDPEKFSRVFRDAAEKLKKKEALFARKAEHYKSVKEYNDYFRKYVSVDFDRDTFLWKIPEHLLDSFMRDSLVRDSLRRDSILRETFRLDSLRRDSLLRDSLRRDSIKREEEHKKILRQMERSVMKQTRHRLDSSRLQLNNKF